MPYLKGRKPAEYASKSSHSQIILNHLVLNFLDECNYQVEASTDILKEVEIISAKNIKNNPIKEVYAIDGSYNKTYIRKRFPSTSVAFYQFGINHNEISYLNQLNEMKFLDPSDVSKLNNTEKYFLILPLKNISRHNYSGLKDSVRSFLFDFFSQPLKESGSLIETLKWFIYEEYSNNPLITHKLNHCPNCDRKNIDLNINEMKNYIFKCPYCGKTIYLTDVFSLDVYLNEYDGEGILELVMSIVEQLLLVKQLKTILNENPEKFETTLFIRDGPLAFFGQFSRLVNSMRNLTTYLINNYNLYLVGVEKTGTFVDYAHEMSDYIENNSIVLLNNDFIYNHIVFYKKANEKYGQKAYYGQKIIFKTKEGKLYVLTLPTLNNTIYNPKKEDYINLDIILNAITKLKTEMYDDALLPIALINKNISISEGVSGSILTELTKQIKF